jgi:hypothetical protein
MCRVLRQKEKTKPLGNMQKTAVKCRGMWEHLSQKATIRRRIKTVMAIMMNAEKSRTLEEQKLTDAARRLYFP